MLDVRNCRAEFSFWNTAIFLEDSETLAGCLIANPASGLIEQKRTNSENRDTEIVER
jgi:hypothetical protein